AARRRLGAQQPVALERAKQPRRLAVPQHERKRIERRHVLSPQRRRGPGDGEIALLEDVPPDPYRGFLPAWLGVARRGRLELRARPGEESLRQLQHLRLAEIP